MFSEELLRVLRTLDTYGIFSCLDTPYSTRYSNANFSAWGHDVPAIREIILQRQEQLNAIDAVINQMKLAHDQLSEKRREIVSSMTAHEGFVSCIRHLPSDILSEIFVHCLPTAQHLRPSPRAVPLLLTRICRRWREVALDTPRLWCSLSVWGKSRAPEAGKQLPFYRDWLEKAKGCTLSLTVHISDSHMPPGSGWKDAAIDFTLPYTVRSTELSLHFGKVNCLSSLLKDVPVLEHLRLNGDLTTLQTAGSHILIEQPQPHLRTLIIRSPMLSLDVLSIFNPGWTNLTHLAIVLLTRQQSSTRDNIFLELLKRCPNLEHFIFSPAQIHRENDPILLTHSKLRLLDVVYSSSSHSLAVSEDSVALPSLHHFIFSDNHYSRYRDETSFFDSDVPPDKLPLVDKSQHRAFSIIVVASINPDIFSFLNPGWMTITHLVFKLHTKADDVILRLLQLCQNLEDLVIFSVPAADSNSEKSSGITTVTVTPVTHNKLPSFAVEAYSGSFLSLLDDLTFPNLHRLSVVFRKARRWPHAEFMRFFSRSLSPLEVLDIKGAQPSTEEQEEIFRLVPTLRKVDEPGRIAEE